MATPAPAPTGLPDDSLRVTASELVRTMGRDANVAEFEGVLVAFFVEAAELLGVPKSVAAIYAICFASAEPLSFADIEERLDISRGSISQGLRVLRDIGALKGVSGPIERREYFSPDLHLRNLVDHWIEARLKRQLDSGRGRLQQLSRKVPAAANSGAKLLRARIRTLQGWNDKARALVPIARTFLKLR